MRFLKNQNINRFTINDQTLMTHANAGRAVMGITGGLRLPQGTTAQRPDPAYGRWPGVTATQTNLEYADGTIRYNIDTDTLECLVAGAWEIVRTAGSRTITKQTFTGTDGVTTDFGPLDPSVEVPLVTPSGLAGAFFDYPIIVLVENVVQISVTNYTIDYNYGGSGDQWIIFESPPPIGKYITILAGFGN